MIQVMDYVAENNLAEFADIFCEKNVFSIEQSRRFLSSARSAGMKLKIHADEMVQLGGTELAVELSMVSADHLLQASDEGIKQLAGSDVIATLLPATAFCLKEEFARARYMIDSGCAVALATDCNPGSSPTESLQNVMTFACFGMRMFPEEIINAMTINAACAIDRQHSIGSIEVNKKADIVIFDSKNLNHLIYHFGVNVVDKVIKNGKIVVER